MSCKPASLVASDRLGSSCSLRNFDVRFAYYNIVAMWDDQRNLWQVTDYCLAFASWLTSYDPVATQLGSQHSGLRVS